MLVWRPIISNPYFLSMRWWFSKLVDALLLKTGIQSFVCLYENTYKFKTLSVNLFRNAKVYIRKHKGLQNILKPSAHIQKRMISKNIILWDCPSILYFFIFFEIFVVLLVWLRNGSTLTKGLQRVVYLGWPKASSYMSPNAGEGGELRGIIQWVQLYTGA
jgi:hypothetical protein